MLEYTLEELIYEYYDKMEREAYIDSLRAKAATDEETKPMEDAMKWADEEERKETGEVTTTPEPSPKDIEWMKKKLEEEKALYGEDFGEDLSVAFGKDEE